MLVGLSTGSAAAGSPGVPVSLPPGEPAANWEHALALGGLVGGPAGHGQAILLTDLGGQWRVQARGVDGRWREATVRVPHTETQREGIIWLAKSLLTAVDVGAGWGDLSAPAFHDDATPPRPEPDTPPPRTRPAAPPRPSFPVAVQVAPPPVSVAAPTMPATPSPAPTSVRTIPPVVPVPVPPAAVAPAPSRETTKSPARIPLGLWASAGGGVTSRPGATVGGEIRAAAGLRLARWVDLGGVFTFSPPTALVQLAGTRTLGDTDVELAAGLTLPGTTGPVVTAHGGAGLRAFFDQALPVTEAWTPTIGATVSLDIPLRGAFSLSPWIDARVDLRPVELRVGRASTELQPVCVKLGVSATLRHELTDRSPTRSAL